MSYRGAQILQSRRISESRDLDAARAFLEPKGFYLDHHPREARSFDFVANALYLPSSFIGYIQYGAGTTVRVPADRARNDYFIHLPLSGEAQVANDAGGAICNQDCGVISSPNGHVLQAQNGSARLTVSLTKAVLTTHLAALLGHAPKQPLEFDAAIDLTSGGGNGSIVLCKWLSSTWTIRRQSIIRS